MTDWREKQHDDLVRMTQEIASLRSESDRLRKALEEIIRFSDDDSEATSIAKDALGGSMEQLKGDEK